MAASVVVATRGRPIRLRWLLNALSRQSIAPECFEVIVAHDPASLATRDVLDTHPLRAGGSLHSVPLPLDATNPGAGRNAAWRRASAPLILFIEDDCRPGPDWIRQALSAAASHPGAVVQGMTLPDPDDAAVARAAPWVRTVSVVPPSPWAEACNIAYPREILERVAGFDESMRMGDDTDLALRARRTGACLVGVPSMVAYRAVEDRSLITAIRSEGARQDLARLVKRHPCLRANVWGRLWCRPEDPALIAAIVGAAAARRKPAAALAAVPWIALSLSHRRYGYRPRAILRAASELPGRALIDATGTLALLRGSLGHRTLLL